MIKKFLHLLISPLDFITKYFKALIFLLILIVLILTIIPQNPSISSPNLGKIYLEGPITKSEGIKEEIDKILKNHAIKGVLFVINSPGGEVATSIEISDMIRELKEKMPVIVYVQGLMASGSYYAGMYADKIYANRGSLIGSIGVVLNGFNIEQLTKKIGIKEQGIAAGKYKEIGTFMREWTPQEKEYLQNLIEEEYKMFISDVADARGLDIKNAKEYAEGKIFSAKKALKLGLIDSIGTENEAIETLKNLAQVQEAIFPKKDKFEAYINKIIKTSTQILMQSITYRLQ